VRLICSTSFLALDAPRTALAKLAWAGFEAAELALPSLEAPLPEAASLRAALEADRLSLAGLATPALNAPDEAFALEAAAALGRSLAWAGTVGAATLRFPAPAAGLETWRRSLLRLLDALRTQPETAEFRFAIEPQPGSLLPSTEAAQAFVRKVSRATVGYCLNLNLARQEGLDSTAILGESRPELVTLSLDAEPAWQESELVEWLTALREAGHAGGLTLTHPGGDAWELDSRAKEAAAWLKSLLPPTNE